MRLKKYSKKGFSLIFADEALIFAEKTHQFTMSPLNLSGSELRMHS